jgi:uncharacterized membrane protein (GlpM family)
VSAIFFFKLIIVPVFIGLITLAGRRWGNRVAGIFTGLPFVAGPIIVFVALDQGTQFAQQTAIAAVSGVFALVVFSLTYCWTCSRLAIVTCVVISGLAWFLAAFGIHLASLSLNAAIILAAISLAAANLLLPRTQADQKNAAATDNLYLRMAIGAGLTILITSLAARLGPIWSGTLSVFPVIGLVLAIFVQVRSGPEQVVELYRGMFKGLYSFATFFVCLALLWPNEGILLACTYAASASIAVQLLVQGRRLKAGIPYRQP